MATHLVRASYVILLPLHASYGILLPCYNYINKLEGGRDGHTCSVFII